MFVYQELCRNELNGAFESTPGSASRDSGSTATKYVNGELMKSVSYSPHCTWIVFGRANPEPVSLHGGKMLH
jgi:hypothetical protein